ncbi:hypothetical protein [Pseudescherichia sp.]|uniref:hypothetical protein n=1 Tax=Pseudescherichia sp. TaxID=2055881 RepID=UPI0028AA27A6|nr:hypothetical protein [Pseudescherichia sp.]
MSLFNEILHFLTPGLDVLQLFFFSLMLIAIVATIWSVKRNAKEQRWQQYLDKGGLNQVKNGLSAELGSAAELSQSVATKAEKVAVIMPGMLLILGLLGTFLGLGLALDKASSILHNSDNSIGAMDNSMRDLMDMMQGLGIKFKTSTWGIIAFIFLKTWESSNGFEERRLNWCLVKLQSVIQEAKQQSAEERSQYRLEQQQNLVTTTTQIVAALQQQTDVLRDEFVQQAKRTEVYEAQRHEHNLATLKEIAQINGQSRNLLETYTTSSQENLHALQEAAATMSDASQKVAASAESLQRVVSTLGNDLNVTMDSIKQELSQVVTEMNSDFTNNVQKMSDMLSDSTAQLSATMSNIEASLGVAITNMGDAFSSNMSTMSSQLVSATTEISGSVDKMSNQIEMTMATVGEQTQAAAKIQRQAMGEFSETSEILNTKVGAMTTYIERVTKEIENGLKSVSENNRKADHSLKCFNQTFEALGKVPEAFEGMSGHINALCALLTQNIEHPAIDKDRQTTTFAITDMQGKMTSLLHEASRLRELLETEYAEA